jgi:hypothetical protein
VLGAFAGYATLRRWAGHLAADAALLATSCSLVVVAPTAITAALASFALGLFLERFWISLQARELTLRPGQAGTVKAVTSVIETAGWFFPVLAGAVADRWGVTGGLAVYAVIAWALAGVAVVLTRSARGDEDGDRVASEVGDGAWPEPREQRDADRDREREPSTEGH